MNKKFIICTHLPEGGLYFIHRVAKLNQLSLVIIQEQPIKRFAKIKAFIKWLFHINHYSHRQYLQSLSRQFPDFNRNEHECQRYKNKLKKLAKQYHFDVIYTTQINQDQQVFKLLSQSNSEYVLVLGGNIIKESIINSFAGKWINGHGGILPNYRGLNSEYWCAVNKELDQIGVTIHQLTKKIDCGEIYAQTYTPAFSEQTLCKVIADNHATLIKTYLGIIDQLANNIAPTALALDGNKKENYFSNPKNISLRALEKRKLSSFNYSHSK